MLSFYPVRCLAGDGFALPARALPAGGGDSRARSRHRPWSVSQRLGGDGVVTLSSQKSKPTHTSSGPRTGGGSRDGETMLHVACRKGRTKVFDRSLITIRALFDYYLTTIQPYFDHYPTIV